MKDQRLIDANALKEYMDRPFWEKWEWEFVCKAIDNAPTVVNEYTKGFADGEKSGRHFPLTDEEKAILVRQWLPQGEWIIKPKENSQSAILICDKCNHFIPITIDKNFCPNCGADMRGKEE